MEAIYSLRGFISANAKGDRSNRVRSFFIL